MIFPLITTKVISFLDHSSGHFRRWVQLLLPFVMELPQSLWSFKSSRKEPYKDTIHPFSILGCMLGPMGLHDPVFLMEFLTQPSFSLGSSSPFSSSSLGLGEEIVDKTESLLTATDASCLTMPLFLNHLSHTAVSANLPCVALCCLHNCMSSFCSPCCSLQASIPPTLDFISCLFHNH